jgi:hypothetical protein
MRDSIKHVFSPGIKFLTDGRIRKSVTNAIAGSRVSASAATSSASNVVNNVYRALRTQWSKQSSAATQALIKQLQSLSKRLSNSRLAIGNLGAKLTNREESATKNTKADEAAPTALPKDDKTSSTLNSNAVKAEKSNMKEKKVTHQNPQHYLGQQKFQPQMQLQQLPAGFPIPVMHPGYHTPPQPLIGQPTGPMDPMVSGYLAPPAVYAVPQPQYSDW